MVAAWNEPIRNSTTGFLIPHSAFRVQHLRGGLETHATASTFAPSHEVRHYHPRRRCRRTVARTGRQDADPGGGNAEHGRDREDGPPGARAHRSRRVRE